MVHCNKRISEKRGVYKGISETEIKRIIYMSEQRSYYEIFAKRRYNNYDGCQHPNGQGHEEDEDE